MLRDDSKVPRLCFGRGDGVNKMCGMQALSWQTGDTVITDYPKCSSRYLSRLVQCLNDKLAYKSGFLSARDSMDMLDLGWLTVGTGNAGDDVTHRWFAELLDNPRWGVVRFLEGGDRELCKAVANAHRRAADWYPVQWSNAPVSALTSDKRKSSQSLAVYVVHHLGAGSVPHWESAVGMACQANYYDGTTKYDRVYWTRTAIEAWRNLQAVAEQKSSIAFQSCASTTVAAPTCAKTGRVASPSRTQTTAPHPTCWGGTSPPPHRTTSGWPT
jgi:hypothetical protein